ncbi:MAG: hypothetical protein J6X07_12245 [Prevotella sp.]|nr:hypothetical protein [Prevotella sp.]
MTEGIKFCPNCGSPMISQQQPQQFQQGRYQQPQQGSYQQPVQQEQPQQSQTGVILKLILYLFYILAAADFLLGTFGIADITGFKYSPILFCVIGAIIGQYVKQKYGITDDEE